MQNEAGVSGKRRGKGGGTNIKKDRVFGSNKKNLEGKKVGKRQNGHDVVGRNHN